MTDAIPTHPAIITRRRHTDMRQRETFQPVQIPGDARRYRPVAALVPSLVGLALFLWIAACVVAFVAGWNA